MSLFQKSVEKKYLNDLDSSLINKKYRDFQNYFGSPDRQENIRNSKEEQFQEGFLRELFVKILGYTLNPEPNFNLTTELKNITNNKKADGAILRRTLEHAPPHFGNAAEHVRLHQPGRKGTGTPDHAPAYSGSGTAEHARLQPGKDKEKNGEHAPLEVTAVIELKGTDTTDLDKIETQAFGYKNHHPKCVYVITSNFEKLRFYIQNAVDHIDFDLFNLTREQFSLLWLCLAKDNLLNGLPQKIKESSLLQEENITKKLYADYSKFREAIYNNLVKNNQETDKLLLFNKTQKLLDRFLFIFFAEDRLLLPPNSISEIVKQWTTLKDLDAYVPLYDRFKKYFGYMNTGYKGKKYDIFAYNGGLFAPDEILDNISIDDEILYKHTLILTQYNFETEVDVNILGHIFEHSLGEIENVQAEIARTAEHAPQLAELPESEGESATPEHAPGHLQAITRGRGEHAPHVSKRKKDGIFYTPKYITKYIVENTVGKLCEEKRVELGIVGEEFAKGRKNRKKEIVRMLDKKLDDYRDWLLTLTILDPACGSGAFLNQALEFLINEHRKIDELRGQLLGGAIIFSDITTDILEKNIYGVDLNEESVEIAKLSLWLRTAQKGRKLNTLSNNIKCGNSLIDDPDVAGEKAFNWYSEFPNIFQKKKKKAWHVTTATHNSRYSQRMFYNHVKKGEPVWLSDKEEIIVTETIAEIVEKDKLNMLAYNICGDHAHMIIACTENELPKIVQKIKAMSARACNIAMGRTTPMAGQGEHAPRRESDADARTREQAPAHSGNTGKGNGEHAPLRGKTQFHLWAEKFDGKEITSNEQLENTIAYILNNRKKHQLPESEKLQSFIQKMTCSRQHAFRAEYDGGFDVVIGNPPYVRADNPGNSLDFREHLIKSNQFETLAGKWDLFIPFIEKSVQLAKPNGKISLIIPDAYCHAEYAKKSIEWSKSNRYLYQIDYFPDIEVFQNVGVKSIIVNLQKAVSPNYTKRIQFNNNTFSDEVFDSYPESLRIDFKRSILNNFLEYYFLNHICYSTKGVVGNSDEKKYKGEFLVGDLLSEIKDETHPKLYFEGKDIGRWILQKQRWIEYGTDRSPVKWSRKGFTEMFEGSPKLVTMRSPGNFPRTFLDDNNGYFNESAIGFKRWIDLKNVNNNSLNKAYETEEERSEFEKISAFYSYNFLLAILNSSVICYELNTNRRSNIHIYPEDWKTLKIPKLNADNQIALEIENKVKTIIQKSVDFQNMSSNFLYYLQSKFQIGKLSKKLQNWDELESKIFLKELQKAKIKLSLSEEAEWLQYFKEQKEKGQAIKSEIEKTEKEIDQMVYELYGLTEEEIKIVEGCV